MASIQDIVNVQISRETTAVAQASFGVVMILGLHKKFNDRVKFYTSTESILADGFLSTDAEYKAAQLVFSQNPRPVQLGIGRRQVDTTTITVSTVDDEATYTITINGNDYTYEAQPDDTGTLIATGLKNAINADGDITVTASSSTDVITISNDVAGVAYTVEVDENLTIGAYTAGETITQSLAAVQTANDSWYGLVITSRVKQNQIDAAAWTEAQKKIFGLASADADILSSSETDDIAYVLKAAGYDRSFVMYDENAATAYPEAAWFGKMLPTAPGQATWAFKALSGVTVSSLTTTERTNAQNKNANTYEARGGANITMEGIAASGEFIDVMRGVDWLESVITERVYSRLVNSPKVPYTDPGVAIIEAEVRASLNLAIQQGLLAQDPAYEIVVPLVKDVSPSDKVARHLPAITFTATLSGAIHYVQITGTVSA